MKIGICIAHGNNFQAEMVATICLMAYHIGRRGDQIYYITSESCLVHKNRNEIFQKAQKLGCDYMMWVDTDNEYSGQGDIITYLLGVMEAQNADMVTGMYYGGCYPYMPILYYFGEKSGKLEQLNWIPEEPFQVDAAGFGFLLMSKKVVDAFTPEFIEEYGDPFDFIFEGVKIKYCEDLAFFYRCRKLGLKTVCDPMVAVEHIKRQRLNKNHYRTAKDQIAKIDQVESGIPGWTTETELKMLGELASHVDSIVEIGSHKGRSADVLLKNCKGEVTCVDIWDGTSELGFDRVQIFDGESIYQEFQKNVGHYPNLKVIREDSKKAAQAFNGNKVDMIFIDGEHTYEGVKADIEAWAPKVTKIIAGHDYSPKWPGVMQAVNEKFERISVCDSVWWVTLEE